MSARINPWPWGIGIFIALFAVAMTSFVVWSLRHRQDLVVRDYYEQDVLHTGVMERTARAAGMNALRHLSAERALMIELPEGASDIQLALYRPSDAKMDRNESIEPLPGSPIRYSTHDLAPGLWRATLEWTLRDEGYRATLAFVVD